MNMYDCSTKYRDACESGKIIYASFYRTLLMLNKVQIRSINISEFMEKHQVCSFTLFGCNDCTEIFLELCIQAGIKPEYIVEPNYNKYRMKQYLSYNLIKDGDWGEIQGSDLVIVMSNYNFNQIAKGLNNIGISYNKIVSIEEFLATLLCERCDK